MALYLMRYNFADAIRKARLAKGLSQEALAKASGASRITIARLEAGSEQDFRLGTLQRLCEALDLDLAALPRGSKAAPEKVRRLDARRRHAALAAALLALAEEKATELVRQARANAEADKDLSRWRARLEGPVRTVALRLLEHNEHTDALLENSPWAFALEPPAP